MVQLTKGLPPRWPGGTGATGSGALVPPAGAAGETTGFPSSGAGAGADDLSRRPLLRPLRAVAKKDRHPPFFWSDQSDRWGGGMVFLVRPARGTDKTSALSRVSWVMGRAGADAFVFAWFGAGAGKASGGAGAGQGQRQPDLRSLPPLSPFFFLYLLEIYLAPLGLFLLALDHLFYRSLAPAARQGLRVVGTLLLYLPAGWSVTFQLGRAPDARYALAFGLLCLGGVAIGTLLRVRAYLLLGGAFLILDVIANLVHASLRDHRLGFVVLSVSGLAVLGAMVFTTLKRASFLRLVRKFRADLASWD